MTNTDTTALAPAPQVPAGIVVSAENLIGLLTAALPFADPDRDDRYPMADTIRIVAGNGVITATATDRYVLGHVRKPAIGTLDEVLLPTEGARRILKVFADTDRTATFVLSADRGGLKVSSTFIDLHVELRVHDGAAKSFAEIGQKLVEPNAEYVGVLAGLPVVNATLLAKIHEAIGTAGYARTEAHLFMRGPRSPLRIEVEDWFVALVMPLKCNEPRTTPQVPFALPADPGPDPVLPVDRLQDASWPQDEREVTVGRMVRALAMETNEATQRMFDDDSGRPENREEALAQMDRAAHAGHAFGAAFLLRAFQAVAPDAAAKAARDLWNMSWDGEAPSEITYDWLAEYGVDIEQARAAMVAARENR